MLLIPSTCDTPSSAVSSSSTVRPCINLQASTKLAGMYTQDMLAASKRPCSSKVLFSKIISEPFCRETRAPALGKRSLMIFRRWRPVRELDTRRWCPWPSKPITSRSSNEETAIVADRAADVGAGHLRLKMAGAGHRKRCWSNWQEMEHREHPHTPAPLEFQILWTETLTCSLPAWSELCLSIVLSHFLSVSLYRWLFWHHSQVEQVRAHVSLLFSSLNSCICWKSSTAA